MHLKSFTGSRRRISLLVIIQPYIATNNVTINIKKLVTSYDSKLNSQSEKSRLSFRK